MVVHNFPDRIIKVNGESYLYFGGTSYLGIATHPEFLRLLTTNLRRWGSSYGSSRKANISLSVYEQTESLFAEKVGSESSIIVSSGTLAGRLVTEYYSSKEYTNYHYPRTHPAILVKNSKAVINDQFQLQRNLTNNKEENIVIAFDSILGMSTSLTNIDFLNNISPTKKITLVIDESHSLGILGEGGWGIFRTIARDRVERVIMVSSLGKAFGISAGVIASDRNFIEKMKREELYISSSGANPTYLETFFSAQHIYKQQQQKLKENLKFVYENLIVQPRLHFSNNYPAIYSNSDSIFRHLQQNKIIISSFKYPTYKTRMNRIVITANHTKADLKKLIDILNNFEL